MFAPASVRVVNVASTTANIHAAARRRLDHPPRVFVIVIAFDLRQLAPKTRTKTSLRDDVHDYFHELARAERESRAIRRRRCSSARINPSHRTASCARHLLAHHHPRRRRRLPSRAAPTTMTTITRRSLARNDDRSASRATTSAGRGARFETTAASSERDAVGSLARAVVRVLFPRV